MYVLGFGTPCFFSNSSQDKLADNNSRTLFKFSTAISSKITLDSIIHEGSLPFSGEKRIHYKKQNVSLLRKKIVLLSSPSLSFAATITTITIISYYKVSWKVRTTAEAYAEFACLATEHEDILGLGLVADMARITVMWRGNKILQFMIALADEIVAFSSSIIFCYTIFFPTIMTASG